MPHNWGQPPTVAQPNPRHTASLAVPFLHVTNMTASLRFYTEGLGFVLTNQWSPDAGAEIRWCWLELDRIALMLQQGAPPAPLGQGVSLCIFCHDAISIYRDLRARGIPASRPFVGNGLWVTSVTDPDGYRLDFESPTDAPEEALLPDD